MLLNFWRHVHLEGAGEYEQIMTPDMTVDEPVYRVTWGVNPAVITGKDGVLAFYNSVGEAVLWNSDDRLAVGDWGHLRRAHVPPDRSWSGPASHRLRGRRSGRAVPHVEPSGLHPRPDDGQARLAGEHLYEDKTSLMIEEVSADKAVTPARVREIHREQLAKLEAERGERFWVLGTDA